MPPTMEASKASVTTPRDDSTILNLNLSSTSSSKHRESPATLMDFANRHLPSLLLVFLLFSGFLLILLLSPSSSDPFSSLRRDACRHSVNTSRTVTVFPRDELDAALERAATRNRTVVIAIVNKAYAEAGVQAKTAMLDLFLESFWLGEGTREVLDHLVLVAVDGTAYERCRFKRLNCFRLESDDPAVDYGGEKIYMSDEFIKMMWGRTRFLLEVLKRGYSFIFTDTDVMWLRNPLDRLSRNTTDVDLQISVDNRGTKSVNTGFYFVRSNNRTIALYDTWYAKRHNSTGMKEQDVLFNLLQSGISRQLNLTVRFLDTTHFSGFCQDSRDISSVATVHANCCRHIRAKVDDLSAVLRDWKRFIATTSKYNMTTAIGRNVTRNFRWSPHEKCWRSWRDANYNPIGK